MEGGGDAWEQDGLAECGGPGWSGSGAGAQLSSAVVNGCLVTGQRQPCMVFAALAMIETHCHLE